MLSIAEVSGLIAAAVMMVQLVLPAALVVILIKYLGAENSAVTWSVVNRSISNTIWPHLVRADSVTTNRVPAKVVLPSYAVTFGAMLLILAGVLTPIGLREEIVPRHSQAVPFQYVRDESPWGRVTMPRPNAPFSRYCEWGVVINCPGQYQGVYMNETEPGTFSSVNTDENSTINTTMPANFTEMFESATSSMGDTRAGLFDIQYRRWGWNQDGIVNFGEPIVKGETIYIGTLIPQDRILLTEGLIVDMRDQPGVGFRNHTIPIGLAHGGSWREDILFVEPVTQCADTNLSVEYRLQDTTDSFTDNGTFFLIDRGAFVDLDEDAMITPPWNDNQTLDLFGRAHRAARQHNVLAARQINVTLPLDNPDSKLPAMRVREESNAVAGMYSPVIGDLDTIVRDEFRGVGGVEPTFPNPAAINTTPPWIPRYENGVKKMVALNYTSVRNMCRGHYEFHTTSNDWRGNNITYPAVECGILIGAPVHPITPGLSPASYTGIRTYQRNLYSCASAMRASVKTVEFLYNGTGASLENLEVRSIEDKKYPDERSKPLWAAEHSYDKVMRLDALWGIVDDRYESYGYDEGFYTMRADKLWIPATPNMGGLLGDLAGYDSLAALSFARHLGSAYGGIDLGAPDYSGKHDFTMAERFRGLSRSQETAGSIPSLILNDGLAAGLVGTKTAISSKFVQWPASLAVDDASEGVPAARVLVYERVIRYDIRYAIPGFIVLALLLFALLWALFILITSRSTISDLRNVYNQTSAGRLAMNLLLAEHADAKQSSSQWARGDGSLPVRFGHISQPEEDFFCTIGTGADGHVVVREEKGLPRGGENAALLTVNPKST